MKLYKHQKEALKRTEDFSNCAFYHDMGLGKTFTGAEKLLRFKRDKNLIVCQKSKIEDWISHFRTNYGISAFNLSKNDDLCVFMSAKNAIGVINYELVFRRAELMNLRNFALMLDESSMIQNDKAKRTKTILKMRPDNVILLSGTPVGGKFENLYSQIKLLGWNITKKEYWSRFIDYEMVQFGRCSPMIPKIKGYKNVEVLKQFLKSYGADFLKSDEVFDLPQQNFNVIKIPVNKSYTDFKMKSYLCLYSTFLKTEVEFVGDTPLKKMLYARQLCGAYNQAKIEAFCDLCDSTDDRLIVFYNFTPELEVLIKSIGKRPYSIVNGYKKDLTAYENENNSITFIQYQAGSMGLNLQKANKIIYFTLPLSSELFEQSKKRIHRIGQEKACFYYFLICKGSIEVSIAETLKKRNDYTQELFNKEF